MPAVYRLDPTVNEAEDLENLTVTLQSSGPSRLIADVAVYDSSGDAVESQVLHHGQGTVIVQARSVESSEAYYVVVSSSLDAPQASHLGGFEVVMDLVPELRLSRQLGEIQLDQEAPILDQPFSVSSSRLVHIHLVGEGDIDLQSAVYVQLIDDNENVITQTVIRPGTSRSAPLTFLHAGDYRLRFTAVSESGQITETRLTVYLDDVSLDVGPGVADPTATPYLACDEPGADPSFCYQYVPITAGPPTAPSTSPGTTQPSYPWWWVYGFTCSDYGLADLAAVQTTDPLWWQFHVDVCQATTPPVTDQPVNDPPVTDPPVTDPPVTDPPVTDPPVTDPPVNDPPVNGAELSPWQNRQNKFDVSGDQRVSAVDALMVINAIGRNAGQMIAVTDTVSDSFTDVNGDFVVSVLDALMVINSLTQGRIVAEAELVAPQAPLETFGGGVSDDFDVALGQLF